MRRLAFAQSAVKLVTDWGLDGIDIDWQYPTNDTERDFVEFLKAYPSPARAVSHRLMDLAAMNKFVDVWHRMVYDYAGSWGTTTGHRANVYLYKDLPRPGATVEYDDVAKPIYSYDAAARELVSYDDVRSAVFKSGYIYERGLSGAFF
ncbi:Uu.00g046790.m01.CDS01 [Anthostomella pinea]|uniref:chitinase n=1 Tax=Anthostomella pinea TaxID=933095 RepID=A0AAI8YEF8_9PEZI|nr:Uu.00g046790.m01.CDS01 [Anthostomella pinea]